MKNYIKKLLAIVVCLLVFPVASFAKTAISAINWESANKTGDKNENFVFSEIDVLDIHGKYSDKLRAVITLNNASEQKEEGLVLRYAIRLQIAKENSADSKAVWEVPYIAEEFRVPVVKAGITKDAKISVKLHEQINRLKGTGFIPVNVKIEIMLTPRLGVQDEARIAESVLPIRYSAPQKNKSDASKNKKSS